MFSGVETNDGNLMGEFFFVTVLLGPPGVTNEIQKRDNFARDVDKKHESN